MTGCLGPGGTPEEPKRCSYCYAHRLAKGRLKPLYFRHSKDYGEFYRVGASSDPFALRYWEDRLGEPKAEGAPGTKVLVCSMGDLFHSYVPSSWIANVIYIIERSAHIFLLLTKNPARYKEFEPWPDNCWLGTTVTNQRDWDERWQALQAVETKVRWVSFEPLLGELTAFSRGPNWIIIGALTGPKAKQPPRLTTLGLTFLAEKWHIPIFHKDNLDCEGMGIERRREWPR